MRVSRIKLRNWRNFQDIDVALTERVFIIGPNASGKSNFLDVFRFLADVVTQGGLKRAVELRGGISKIRSVFARRKPVIMIEIHLTDADESQWLYRIEIDKGGPKPHVPVVVSEYVERGGEVLLQRPDPSDKDDPLRLTQTALEQVTANEKFRKIKEHFEETVYLHLVPQVLRYSEHFSGPELAGDPFGRNLLNRMVKVRKDERDARLRKISAALTGIVPTLTNLKLVQKSGVSHLQASCNNWRPEGVRQNEDQLSDGTLRLIGLFWSILESQALLLLEEPELSLNGAVVRRLPGILYHFQRQTNRQVIVSTHSSNLLSDPGIGPEEVLLLMTGTEETRVVPAASNDAIRQLVEVGMNMSEAAFPMIDPDPDSLAEINLFR